MIIRSLTVTCHMIVYCCCRYLNRIIAKVIAMKTQTHLIDHNVALKQRRAVEINYPISLSNEDFNLVMMHSLLNIFNILIRDMRHFGNSMHDSKLLVPAILQLESIKSHLTNERLTNMHLDEINSIKEFMTNSLIVALEGTPQLSTNTSIKLDIESMVAVLEQLHHKANIYLGIRGNQFAWKTYNISELKNEIKRFFHVVVVNNRNRFNVVYSKLDQSVTDYLVILSFKPTNGNITIPAMLCDVMIDLLANARKYSKPGTTIRCNLEIGKSITLTVKDQGRGIPANEIEKVVKLNYRATNCQQKNTMGSGIGLTKAYIVTKMHEGRFWITSALDQGTEVRIEIPVR